MQDFIMSLKPTHDVNCVISSTLSSLNHMFVCLLVLLNICRSLVGSEGEICCTDDFFICNGQ